MVENTSASDAPLSLLRKFRSRPSCWNPALAEDALRSQVLWMHPRLQTP